MEPTILFEDKDVLVVNKPAGLIVHSDGRRTLITNGKTKEKTLVDFLLEKYPKIKDVGEPKRIEVRSTNDEVREEREIQRSGIVHRLDRETSGVMIVAKTQKSFENLKKQFQERQVKKIYQAFVYGEMKTKSGTIDRPIGRSSQDFRMWSAQRGARGELREAVTNYKVLRVREGYSFVEVSPQTGRTHQIRVHFKAINYPLVADPLYAPKRQNTLGFTRLALHSLNVTFADLKGKSRTVTAPYPEDFERAMGILQIT